MLVTQLTGQPLLSGVEVLVRGFAELVSGLWPEGAAAATSLREQEIWQVSVVGSTPVA